MTDYDRIFFDLDGTLTDSGPGIINAIIYALERFGITAESRESLRRFVGPPLHESFMRFYGFDGAKALHAVDVFREYYNDTGIFENSVYPGIEKLLKDLRSAGKMLMVATSKPEIAARRVLEHFDLAKYFDFVAGASQDSSVVKKADIVAGVLRATGSDADRVLMIGDREHDVIGAGENGMSCMGVLWGYGSREELVKAGAAYIAATPLEAERIILGKET